MVDAGVVICSTVTTAAICCGVGLLLLVILLPLSFSYLRYDEYGLDYNSITKKVDLNSTYEPGRHFLGVGHSFIKYPRTYQTIDFSAESGLKPVFARTGDGLSIDLEVSFQYKIYPKQLLKVFEKFAREYNVVVDIVARNSIRDTASKYNAIQFFSERKEIGEAIEEDLRDALRKVDVTLEFLQLRNVDLPDQYENIIELKEIERQKIITAQYQQQSEVVNAETNVLVSQRDARTVEIQAQANADAVRINAEAEAYAISTQISAEASSLDLLKAEAGFSNEQLLGFAWLEAVRQKKGASVIVNLDKPAIISIPGQN